jgi:RTA1 like protein
MAANPSTGNIGNNIMMVGLASQVVTLAAFGLMSLDVYLRIRKYQGAFNDTTNALRSSRRFKGLLVSLVVAYTTIFIRCIYRIAEMAGGWQNKIMQNQPAFIALDGV